MQVATSLFHFLEGWIFPWGAVTVRRACCACCGQSSGVRVTGSAELAPALLLQHGIAWQMALSGSVGAVLDGTIVWWIDSQTHGGSALCTHLHICLGVA